MKKINSAQEELVNLIGKVLQIGRKRANDSEGSNTEAHVNKIRQEDKMEACSSSKEQETVTNDSEVSVSLMNHIHCTCISIAYLLFT